MKLGFDTGLCGGDCKSPHITDCKSVLQMPGKSVLRVPGKSGLRVEQQVESICNICPRNCGVNRKQDRGFCSATDQLEVNLHQLHFGEEPVLSGTRGSGTIFFTHCNLKCVFCQNYQISAGGWGKTVSEPELAEMMLSLQQQGAHNVNLVTPSHYSLQIIRALSIARQQGLTLPIVWNSNGYESVEMLKLLEGWVDIYLPDFKFYYGKHAQRYTAAEDYPAVAKQAILEMHRQTGKLVTDATGMAKRGIIIRLLVLPGRVSGTREILHWINDNLGNDTYISLMAQYYPAHRVGAGLEFAPPLTDPGSEFNEINRGITLSEYDEVLTVMEALGFTQGFIQELSCSAEWTPAFKKENAK